MNSVLVQLNYIGFQFGLDNHFRNFLKSDKTLDLVFLVRFPFFQIVFSIMDLVFYRLQFRFSVFGYARPIERGIFTIRGSRW